MTKDNRLIINNNIVYFNISPLVLIVSTVVIYFAITAFKHYFGYKIAHNSCKVKIEYGNCSITINCLIDTGNLLKDNFTNKPIIIVNKKSCHELLNLKNIDIDNLYNLKGFRLVPIKCINNDSILTTFKANKIVAYFDYKTLEIDGFIAISKSDITSAYQGIIGSYALSLGEELTYA